MSSSVGPPPHHCLLWRSSSFLSPRLYLHCFPLLPLGIAFQGQPPALSFARLDWGPLMVTSPQQAGQSVATPAIVFSISHEVRVASLSGKGLLVSFVTPVPTAGFGGDQVLSTEGGAGWNSPGCGECGVSPITRNSATLAGSRGRTGLALRLQSSGMGSGLLISHLCLLLQYCG